MNTVTTMDDRHSGMKWRLEYQRLNHQALELVIAGHWCLDEDLPLPDIVQEQLLNDVTSLQFNTSELESWDSGLLAFLAGVLELCHANKITTDLSGLPHGLRHLLTMAAAVPEQKIEGRDSAREGIVFRVGMKTQAFFHGALDMLTFLGEITQSMGRLITGRAKFRGRDLWLEIQEVGPKGLGIVSVISFLVGLILAYLGADQLRLVGAQIFIADLVAIGMVREVGALMTGIIIAGRTGAAFAAQLGTMQVNEEIDAYRTLGISPVDFLVLPKILALMLMMPLLTLYAGFVGMFAGFLISITIFDISVFEYYTETLRALEIKHFLVGLCKGTVYGAMVAYAGCLRGMQCGRSAEAVGEAATSAVVTGILLITISASILTIIFYQLGI
jgi:phospholipid/cholesterol/gamma-HCH transport system permease protein